MEYHIFTGTDSNYLPQTAVLIYSIVTATASSKRPAGDDVLVFHVMGDGLTDADKRNIKLFGDNLSSIFPSQLILHSADASDFSDFKGWTESNSHSTYLRFLIPHFVKKSVKRVLYLDADMICNADLRELFDIDLEGNVLGAVCDAISSHAINKEFRLRSKSFIKPNVRLRYKAGESYFNAGMLLIDLDRWQEEKVLERCIGILHSYATPMCDQDALNLCLKGKVKQLSAKWNLLWPLTFKETASLLESSKSMKDAVLGELTLPYAQGEKTAALLHFAGYFKPWRKGRFILDDGYPSSSLMEIKRNYLERAVSVPIFGKNFSSLQDECLDTNSETISMQLGNVIADWFAHNRFPAIEKSMRRGIRQRSFIKLLATLQALELALIAWLVWFIFL